MNIVPPAPYAELTDGLAAVLARELGRERTAVSDGVPDESADIERVARAIEAQSDAAAIVEWPDSAAPPRILYVNRAFETLLGFPAAEAVGATTAILSGPLTDADRVAFLNERLRTTFEARMPIVYYRRDGLPLWVEGSLRGVAATASTPPYVVATFRDITARKEFELALAKEKRKLQVTLAAIGDGVITTVADGRVDYVNLAARAMLGIDPAEAYGAPIGDVLRLRDAAGQRIDVLHGADGPEGIRGEVQFEGGTSRQDVAYVTSPVGTEGYVVVLRDVTAQRRLAHRLSYEASHDALTRLSNRRKFEEVLDDAVESARAGAGPHVLAFLDLDRFKIINDSCGHAVGDRVLAEVARLLQSQLRERDLVARIGGDEFAVLLHDCSLDNARTVFENLRLTVEAYRTYAGGREYGVGVSIGITLVDGSETDCGRIVARADAACYAVKSAGRKAVGADSFGLAR